MPLTSAIDAIEDWYSAQSRPVIFKPAGPEGLLEAELARRGYIRRTPTMVMIADIGEPNPPVSDVTLETELTPSFSMVFAKAQSDPEDTRERLEAMMRVPFPRAMAVRHDQDGPVAIGAMAVENEWCGLFAMRTLSEAQRKGHARKIVASLLWQAWMHGARSAWLQVETGNSPAVSLYRDFGFREAYRYHYWER